MIGNFNEEKKRALDILNKITNKQPTLNITQATNQEIYTEEGKRYVLVNLWVCDYKCSTLKYAFY